MILFVGDVHGRWERLLARLERAGVSHADIVQVGDFGLGFLSPADEDASLLPLDRFLARQDCRLWVIRGNHDDPSRWQAPARWQAIHLVPDYTVLRLQGVAMLCVGGAISIDRTVRSTSHYWPREGFALDPVRLAILDLYDVSVVVTHTAPYDVAPVAITPIVFQFVPGDPHLLDDLREERRQVAILRDQILQRATPRLWCYGHFHTSARERVGPLAYVLLNILEIVPISSLTSR